MTVEEGTERKLCVYVASGLGFTAPGRRWISNALNPALRHLRLEVRCPWEMTSVKEVNYVNDTDSIAERRERYEEFEQTVGARNLDAISSADFMIVHLDGTDVDAGAAAEVGFAYAMGIPIFGFHTDWRNSGELAGFVALQVAFCMTDKERPLNFLHRGEFDGFLEKLSAVLPHLTDSNSNLVT